jgi:hypothetical protein
MKVSLTEYLSMLADFNKNISISGFHGQVETNWNIENVKNYNVKQSFLQKDLTKE